jgi:hypothetical protein
MKSFPTWWRNAAAVAIWLATMAVMLVPAVCDAHPACRKSSFAIVLTLGVVGALLWLSDRPRVKKEVKRRFMRSGRIDTD